MFFSVILLVLFIFGIHQTIRVFTGDYGTFVKVVCVVALVILFFWLLFRFMDLTSDSLASKTFRGRKIFIDQSGGGYGMLRVVYFLNSCFAQLGAVIVADVSEAEFQLTLSPDMMDLMVIVCRLSDQHGNTITLRERGHHWPKSLTLAFARFIRESD